MPSVSLLRWQNDRIRSLADVDAQCAASLGLRAPNPRLVDENLRAYVLLLSAHFQGFCRDLYTECSQAIVSRVRPSLQVLVQAQFSAHRRLDHGNPNVRNIREDFERFGVSIHLAAVDPSNGPRLIHLAEMMQWRNIAAHHATPTAAAGPLTMARLQAWLIACTGLATSLDQVMYNRLRGVLRRAPW